MRKPKADGKVRIFFTGPKNLIENFMSWLCEQGEQDYWQYEEAGGNQVVESFKYDFDEGLIIGTPGPELVEDD